MNKILQSFKELQSVKRILIEMLFANILKCYENKANYLYVTVYKRFILESFILSNMTAENQANMS